MKYFDKTFCLFIKPVLIFILSFFFDKKYLKGRFFDKTRGGYIFAVRALWQRNILRLARPLPWPASTGCVVSNEDNIVFDPDDLNNFQTFGTYFQNFDAKIIIGKGTYIAPNVGIITANHDVYDLDNHLPGKDIILGEKCWIGMNSVILPGVVLGSKTIVGAGSVVTKSFPSGNCVIAGVPARIVRDI